LIFTFKHKKDILLINGGLKTMLIKYIEYKPNEYQSLTDREEKEKHFNNIISEVKKLDIHGHIDIEYYNHSALIYFNQKIYNVYDYKTGKLFERLYIHSVDNSIWVVKNIDNEAIGMTDKQLDNLSEYYSQYFN
jgi:sortase (surface protein transpeptidase)